VHITGWEFAALTFIVIIFYPRVVCHAVSLIADAFSTILVLLRQHSLSPVPQVIHALLVNLPEFRALGLSKFSKIAYMAASMSSAIQQAGV
jgi:hypothetical protein